MDEVGFWDRALTAPEMDALFFLSEGEGEFVADAQGAADIFDFFENGAVGDQAVFNGIGFEIVDDVVALGGIAGQSTEVDGQLLLGLNGTTGGLASFAVPEPTSIAVWSLAGLIALGLGRRSWNRRRDIQFN